MKETPMDKIMDLAENKIHECFSNPKYNSRRELIGWIFPENNEVAEASCKYRTNEWLAYLESIGAVLVENMFPPHEEDEPEEEWEKRCDEYVDAMAKETGMFPVYMPRRGKLKTKFKGFLIPNELANKILVLNSFP